ncbi:SH3 domain-containing protein [Methyloversatilis sp.]|uniref:SH3 domain-containing protein n=1 Tax=Methyloversatilis sp. TaxID=2569862 RepID=UPI0035B325FC
MKRLRALAALAAALAPAAFAAGIEYRSLVDVAVMYDAPSKQARQQYVIARQTPVEVVRTQAGWVKVREPGGMLAWVEASALSPQRTLIVTAEKARVLARPEEAAPLVFEAERRVVLEPVSEAAPAGWARVKHRDGQSGYLRISEVWGL